MNRLLERFLRYISMDTQSCETSGTVPSTKAQTAFAAMLAEELQQAGLQQIHLSPYGILTATLPANTNRPIPPIGFIAHMDTSPDFSGADVQAQIHPDYRGTDLVLGNHIVLSTTMFPQLKQYTGYTIITTDGTTLLGADDKAGIAEIIYAMEYLTAHPEIEHGDIHIAFTPDEEIGRGVDHFDLPAFKARYAYTVDGGGEGEFEYENFNAAQAEIMIRGCNVHPGSAKGIMLNSQLIAMELQQMLPSRQRPELTEDREGFFHLCHINGTVELSTLSYIIRDHDKNEFEHKKLLLQQCVYQLNQKYGQCISCQISDQYYNMKEIIEKVPFMVDLAKLSITQAGAVPHILPIRGGTDGARLSFMGLPCPNLFTGGHNFHGKYEFTVLESMYKASMTIVNLARNYALADIPDHI
ncbi:MAG: peptidase T [Bacteroidales bacterium]|nr:peptidase T [Bacteroidales bacterium]